MAEFIIHILQGLAILALSLDSLTKTKNIRWLEGRAQWLEGEVERMIKEDPVEQRCGTCKERFTCPAWPGVAYPCQHYNDQDGIMEARRRKEAEEEEIFWATQERLREELMNDGEEE